VHCRDADSTTTKDTGGAHVSVLVHADLLYGAFFFNPGFDPARNNVGGGLTVVSAGGASRHIDVTINEFTLLGAWSSSDGTSGQLIPQ
jgi:hypothetical protein